MKVYVITNNTFSLELTFDANFQFNVIIILVIMEQVWEGFGILWVVVH